MSLCTSVYMCFVVTCWERADLLALVCSVLLGVCHFPIGILGQVWYLIVSIPDLCTLTYFIHVSTTSTSTYTLILHRASASRASDVINMVKISVYTVKTFGCSVYNM